ncbi:MAG: hypothetical protein ACI9NT_002067, partial [Bacteroidia bacterium]
MVQVRQQDHFDDQGEIDVSCWVDNLPLHFVVEDRATLARAAALVEETRNAPGDDVSDWVRGGDSFVAGLDITLILAELHVDLDG